jgi:hypothetical protein
VLPYKGPNGTWRRPIVIECTRGGASLQPNGPKFTILDLSPRILPRSSVFVKAVARELFHIRSADTPDGAPAVPYIVFLVRPDGVGPYYLARTCLEPLGIAFGYELVEQNLEVNIPDFDNVATWDGTVPLDLPLERAPAAGSRSSRLAQSNQPLDQPKTGLAALPGGDQGSMTGALDGARQGNRQGGQGIASSGAAVPEDFVWPGRGRGAGRDGAQSSGALGDPERGSQVAGGNSALPSRSGDEDGKGRFAASARGTMGYVDLPGGSSSGMTPGATNAEDVGTGSGSGSGSIAGSGTDPAEQPFAGSGPGTGRGAGGEIAPIADGNGTGGGVNGTGSAVNGTGGGVNGTGSAVNGTGGGVNGTGSAVNGTGGGSSAADSIFQVPNFEPAGDQATGPASLAQPGLLSGRGSRGGTGAGVQAPAFGLGQTVKGSATTGGET